MKKSYVLMMCIFLLASCQTATPLSSEHTVPEDIAAKLTCGEISTEIYKMDQILDSASPSETERLMQDTAVSAAKTGLSYSGALGGAGPFAGLGLNFMQRLYSINAKQRQQEVKDAAQIHKTIMLDAYDYKGCV